MVMEMLARLLDAGVKTGVDDENGPLKGAKVMTFSNGVAEQVNLVLANLTENTFTGYARSAAVAWGTRFVSTQTGVPCIPGDEKIFACSGGDEQQVAGYALISSDVTPVLLVVRVFETAIAVGPGNAFGIVPRFGLTPAEKVPPGDLVIY